MAKITIGDIEIEVIQKDIKNVHLSVYPPHGRVRISAPLHMDLDMLRLYSISRLAWIRKHQKKIQSQPREAKREYLSKESHYYLGKRYLLVVNSQATANTVRLKHNTIELNVRPNIETTKKKELLELWYRNQLKEIVKKLIAKWEPIISVKVAEFGIKKMKTKWGTCNSEASRIWINLELAKKPIQCIEYIVVHELVHFLERNHTNRFVSIMNQHLPNWRELKDELNRLQVAHTDWGY
jgi:predicted metal-dependent hydrolase